MDLKATRLVAVVTNSEQEAERQVNSWLNYFEDLEFTRFELESGRVGFAAKGDFKSNIKTVVTTIKENDIPIPPHVEVILCPVVHGRLIDVNVNDDDEDVANADVFTLVRPSGLTVQSLEDITTENELETGSVNEPEDVIPEDDEEAVDSIFDNEDEDEPEGTVEGSNENDDVFDNETELTDEEIETDDESGVFDDAPEPDELVDETDVVIGDDDAELHIPPVERDDVITQIIDDIIPNSPDEIDDGPLNSGLTDDQIEQLDPMARQMIDSVKSSYEWSLNQLRTDVNMGGQGNEFNAIADIKRVVADTYIADTPANIETLATYQQSLEQMHIDLENQAFDIRQSYRDEEDDWIEEQVRKLREQYRRANPDHSDAVIEKLVNELRPKMMELEKQANEHRMDAAHDIIHLLNKLNIDTSSLRHAVKFKESKQDAQRRLDSDVARILSEWSARAGEDNKNDGDKAQIVVTDTPQDTNDGLGDNTSAPIRVQRDDEIVTGDGRARVVPSFFMNHTEPSMDEDVVTNDSTFDHEGTEVDTEDMVIGEEDNVSSELESETDNDADEDGETDLAPNEDEDDVDVDVDEDTGEVLDFDEDEAEEESETDEAEAPDEEDDEADSVTSSLDELDGSGEDEAPKELSAAKKLIIGIGSVVVVGSLMSLAAFVWPGFATGGDEGKEPTAVTRSEDGSVERPSDAEEQAAVEAELKGNDTDLSGRYRAGDKIRVLLSGDEIATVTITGFNPEGGAIADDSSGNRTEISQTVLNSFADRNPDTFADRQDVFDTLDSDNLTGDEGK